MAATAAQLRTLIRNELYGADVTTRPYETTLTAPSLTADTTIDVVNGAAWAAGDIGEFEDGEQVLVISVATNTLTVKRSYGAVAAADRATDDILRKNPKYTIEQIDQAVSGILEDLRPDVYEVATKTVSYDPTTRWYPFSAGDDARIFEVISVYNKPTNEDHPVPVDGWIYQRDIDPTDFTAAHGILIPQSINVPGTSNIHITVKKAVQAITSADSLWATMIGYGAVYSLLGGGDVRRIHDPGKRTDRTVQPGSESRSSIWYLREYIRRKERIAADLRAREGNMVRSRISQRARRYRA